MMLYLYIKRIFDILVSAILGIVLLPLMLILGCLVRLDSKGPAVFSQKRFGKEKSFFTLYKFRTMANNAPHDMPTGEFANAASWITPLGGFLRKTSLDELPQLWNILKGDMSFIGPRPALWNQTELIAERDKYAGRGGLTPNTLRPGLTGWAQINGRDLLNDAEKAAFDGEYAKRIGFLFDLKCLFMTVTSVLGSKGVSEGGLAGQAQKEKKA